MKQVVFEQIAKVVNITNDKPHVEKFKGIARIPLSITKIITSCGCTGANYPPTLEGDFEVDMLVNKTGSSGFYSVSLELVFSNGERQMLSLGGEIIKTE